MQRFIFIADSGDPPNLKAPRFTVDDLTTGFTYELTAQYDLANNKSHPRLRRGKVGGHPSGGLVDDGERAMMFWLQLGTAIEPDNSEDHMMVTMQNLKNMRLFFSNAYDAIKGYCAEEHTDVDKEMAINRYIAGTL